MPQSRFVRCLIAQHNPATADRRFAAFPFAADLVQAVDAEFEVVAEAFENFGFGVGLADGNRAGDFVRAFAVRAVVDEVIVTLAAALLLEALGIDAGPKQGEITDVPQGFALRFADAGFGFEHHVGYVVEAAAGEIAEAKHRIQADEPGQQIGHVIDQLYVSHAEPRFKGVLGQPGEEAAECFVGMFGRHGSG